MPALIIGANIPDIDASCVVFGTESLAMRRGLTHGPIAWLLLPLLLAGTLWWFDRWKQRRGRRPEARLPVHFGWLFALSLIGCLTHPLLDWMNSYGIRLLEPFSHRWFYGDALFIVDIWLWVGLGLATWLSLRREKRAQNWRAPARLALAATALYLAANVSLAHFAEQRLLRSEPYPLVAIANPVPAAFWQREPIIRLGDGLWQVGGRKVGDVPLARCDLASARRADPAVDAFLFWSRAPVIWRDGERLTLGDARFAGELTRGRFAAVLPEGTCN